LTLKKVGMTLKRREWLKITIRGVMRTLFELKALECTGQPKGWNSNSSPRKSNQMNTTINVAR